MASHLLNAPSGVRASVYLVNHRGFRMTQLEVPGWYAVYTKPRKEGSAKFHLQLRGLEVFLPFLLLPKIGRHGGRIVPLFPTYIFAQIRSLDQFQYVRWSPGVKRIVGFNGVPAPLDRSIVAFLMKQATPEGVLVARSNLKVGEEVMITGGPFEGLIGIIQEPPSARGRVKVLMELLNRQVRVDVPVEFVKSGWVAWDPAVSAAEDS